MQNRLKTHQFNFNLFINKFTFIKLEMKNSLISTLYCLSLNPCPNNNVVQKDLMPLGLIIRIKLAAKQKYFLTSHLSRVIKVLLVTQPKLILTQLILKS